MWEKIIVSIVGTIIIALSIYSAVSLALKNTINGSLLKKKELEYKIKKYEKKYM